MNIIYYFVLSIGCTAILMMLLDFLCFVFTPTIKKNEDSV